MIPVSPPRTAGAVTDICYMAIGSMKSINPRPMIWRKSAADNTCFCAPSFTDRKSVMRCGSNDLSLWVRSLKGRVGIVLGVGNSDWKSPQVNKSPCLGRLTLVPPSQGDIYHATWSKICLPIQKLGKCYTFYLRPLFILVVGRESNRRHRNDLLRQRLGGGGFRYRICPR